MAKQTNSPQTIEKLYVKVPGTSANLGPGFDILGLALQVYNEFYFEFNETAQYEMHLLDGSSLPFTVENNLLLQAYKTYYHTFLQSQQIFPYSVKMNLNLPIKGGLGSSATALVAGFCAASYIHKKFYDFIPFPSEREFLYNLAKLEGHPDNTTPAFLGGFIFSYFDEEQLIYYKKNLPNSLSLFLFIPEFQTETKGSRKKLPDKYPTKDIIFNMSRMGTWMQYLETQNYEDLKLAIQDKLHTPYRIDQLPFLKKVSQIITDLGYCFSLSGSGPSLLIYCPKESKEIFLRDFKQKLNFFELPINYKIIETKICQEGTIIQEIPTNKLEVNQKIIQGI